MFSKLFSPFTKQKPDRSEKADDFPCLISITAFLRAAVKHFLSPHE